MTDMAIHSKSKTLEKPTNDPNILKLTAKELFENLLTETEHDIRRVGVKVSNLTRKEKRQQKITSFIESQPN
jgi:nucleotidyltransferase/DNA polymerase involved in DNA repair